MKNLLKPDLAMVGGLIFGVYVLPLIFAEMHKKR